MIEAKVICDSITEYSPRLTTLQLRYPRFIHPELMTHRAFSRNASSSRAVPVRKNLEEVRNPDLKAGPVWWGKEQKGMQSGEELDPETKQDTEFWWDEAAINAVAVAEKLMSLNAHKSIVNRLLEPFLHINVVLTSCEPGLMNFFGLRLDRGTQPEMRILAEEMWKEWNDSEPRKLKPGEWHLPWIEDEDWIIMQNTVGMNPYCIEYLRRVSAARCARVSYLSFETQKRSTIEEDLRLYDRLVGSRPMHLSPCEHQATPDTKMSWEIKLIGGLPIVQTGYWNHPEEHGNFSGWRQFRKMIPGEAIAPLPPEYVEKSNVLTP